MTEWEKKRDDAAENYRRERNWPTKKEWVERKGDLDSRSSYAVGDYVEEAFLDGQDWTLANAPLKVLAEKNAEVRELVEALKLIANADTYDGKGGKYNNYRDGWFGVIDHATKALKGVE